MLAFIYVVAVVKYSTKQADELNARWNSVYTKVFGFIKYESVNCFICRLGRTSLESSIGFIFMFYVVVI